MCVLLGTYVVYMFFIVVQSFLQQKERRWSSALKSVRETK